MNEVGIWQAVLSEFSNQRTLERLHRKYDYPEQMISTVVQDVAKEIHNAIQNEGIPQSELQQIAWFALDNNMPWMDGREKDQMAKSISTTIYHYPRGRFL